MFFKTTVFVIKENWQHFTGKITASFTINIILFLPTGILSSHFLTDTWQRLLRISKSLDLADLFLMFSWRVVPRIRPSFCSSGSSYIVNKALEWESLLRFLLNDYIQMLFPLPCNSLWIECRKVTPIQIKSQLFSSIWNCTPSCSVTVSAVFS